MYSRCVAPENTPPQSFKGELHFSACLSGVRAFAEMKRTFLLQTRGESHE